MVPQPGIHDYVARTLLVELEPETPPDLVRDFERRLAGMPRYIGGIRNWTISRNPRALEYPEPDDYVPRWTHVWEQEFEDQAGFSDYMLSPYYWGWVDLPFDRDGP